ncbi:MAG: hypothetical protein HC884_06775 [Chloroflexaceae bacterium]|nr:hypothetical protein [Chloroflexaceae bacterium]
MHQFPHLPEHHKVPLGFVRGAVTGRAVGVKPNPTERLAVEFAGKGPPPANAAAATTPATKQITR